MLTISVQQRSVTLELKLNSTTTADAASCLPRFQQYGCWLLFYLIGYCKLNRRNYYFVIWACSF